MASLTWEASGVRLSVTTGARHLLLQEEWSSASSRSHLSTRANPEQECGGEWRWRPLSPYESRAYIHVKRRTRIGRDAAHLGRVSVRSSSTTTQHDVTFTRTRTTRGTSDVTGLLRARSRRPGSDGRSAKPRPNRSRQTTTHAALVALATTRRRPRILSWPFCST